MHDIASLARVVAGAIGDTDAALDRLSRAWADPGTPVFDELPAEAAEAAVLLGQMLAECTTKPTGIAGRAIATDDASRAVIAAWVEAAAERSDLVLSPLLVAIREGGTNLARVDAAALRRVRGGPLRDALACLGACSDSAWLGDPAHRATRARLALLLWEVGAAGTSVPELGRWLFGNSAAFKALVLDNGAGELRQRALAARALAAAADGVGDCDASRAVQVATDRLLRRLASHPDAAVWIPAARAIGRLATRLGDVRRLLFSWLDSDNAGERRRAVTALASMPAAESAKVRERLEALVADQKDPWIIAAVGPAIPHMVVEQRESWNRVVALLDDSPAPEILWSVAQGLAAMSRGEAVDRSGDRILRRIRDRALAARPTSATEAQLWLAIRSDTDFLDHLEPDPSDPHRLLDHHVSAAQRLGAARVVERARFVARSLLATFQTSLPSAMPGGDLERRAASCSTLESCARAAALRLWEPILEAADAPIGGLDAEAREARVAMVRELAPRMAVPEPDHAFHRTALRVLGYAADADEGIAGVLEGVETAPWVAAGGRAAARFRKPISDVLWRVVDSTRQSAVVADPHLYPRFAAWWALSSAVGAQLLEQLPRSEAAARVEGSDVEATVEAIRSALDARAPGVVEGAWVMPVLALLDRLGAADTPLAEGLADLGSALELAMESRNYRTAASLERSLELMVSAASRMRGLLADPRRALVSAPATEADTEQSAAEVGTLVRTTRRASSFDAEEYAQRWSLGLGPLLSPLVTRALKLLLEAHVGLKATTGTTTRQEVGGYRLVKVLGEGQMGAVWLVCDPDTERYFVMKLPAAAFTSCGAEDRGYLEEAVRLETQVLRTIYHPNLANLIDFGWDGSTPFMVLEYLAGVDLEEYLASRLLGIAECKEVVADICAGLLALHARGLVHRDLKPGNVFMRLDLGAPGTLFDSRKHRDQKVTPLLGAVIIDFGLAATKRTRDEVSEKLALGTLGFMPPEQARGSTDVDGKSDVYALAALVHASLTGHAFFELSNFTANEWVRAHATQEPLAADPFVAKLPRPVARLLRDATRLDPTKRPDVARFAERFESLAIG